MELSPPLLQLATQALDLVLDFKRPADAVLSAFFREHKKLGSHDRAFVAEAVFGVLRRYRYLSVVVPAANPRTLIIAWLIKARGMSGATLEKFAKPELIDHIRNAKTDDLPLAVSGRVARLGNRETAAVDDATPTSSRSAARCSSRRRSTCG